MTEHQGNDSGDDRPGPYRGSFGSGPRPAYDDTSQWTVPKQVTVASTISLALGGISILLAALALTSAGEQISEVLTGSRDNASVAVAAALVCAVIYVVPAIYVRKRRPWARYLLIAVAGIGIAGGVMALPSSILGVVIHATLLILMLQQPTKLWFHHH